MRLSSLREGQRFRFESNSRLAKLLRKGPGSAFVEIEKPISEEGKKLPPERVHVALQSPVEPL